MRCAAQLRLRGEVAVPPHDFVNRAVCQSLDFPGSESAAPYSICYITVALSHVVSVRVARRQTNFDLSDDPDL